MTEAGRSPRRWPLDAEVLRHEQAVLAGLAPRPWRFAADMCVGACFVCFTEEAAAEPASAEPAWAAAVVFDSSGARAAAAVVEGVAAEPYRYGLLALREGPLLEHAVARLSRAPDVLLVNASGRDHPRRAGLALHLGAVIELPTVGVTDRPLLGEVTTGEGAPVLRLDGRVVATLVRPLGSGRGVWAHAAWRTDAATARAVVEAVTRMARTPTPLREARRLARVARAAARGVAPYPPGDPRPTRVA